MTTTNHPAIKSVTWEPGSDDAPRPLHVIAADIRKHWRDKTGAPCINYAAKPYLTAMLELESIHDNYYCDSAKSIVIYFLSNAQTWRGDDARRIKAELKAIAGIK